MRIRIRSYRAISREDWGFDVDANKTTTNEINCGSLLRIADSLEKIARQLDRLGSIEHAARSLARIDKRMAKRTPLRPKRS